MDKNQLSMIIAQVYRSLTPSKISVFKKNDEMLSVRVTSDAFKGMTFSSRFKLLNQLLKEQNIELFKQYVFIFEAFTSEELHQLSIEESNTSENTNNPYKKSAKELES